MNKLIHLLLICCLLISCKVNHGLNQIEKENLATKLNEIRLEDQFYAGTAPDSIIKKHGFEKGWEIFAAKGDSVNNVHQKAITQLYKKYGFLTENKIGVRASQNFWLPIQHADKNVAFQKRMLKAFKKAKELSLKDKYKIAMLEDRVNINTGKPQRFGSQTAYRENGHAYPKNGLIDSLKVDSLRAAYGLSSLKEYYNDMTIINFDMNRESLEEKGILKPVLYP